MKPYPCGVVIVTLLLITSVQAILDDNIFLLNGNRFATLDDVKYDTLSWSGDAGWKACDNVNFVPVPDGWLVAPNDADSLQVIAMNQWGTWQLVLADGTSWFAKPSGTVSDTPADRDQLVSDNAGGYHPRFCDRRILIKAKGPGGLYTGPPAVTITNFVVLDGVKWATLDNADPNGGSPCVQDVFYGLPTGWTVAPNTYKARMAIGMFTWSAYRVVLSDGSAWQPKEHFFLDTVHTETPAATGMLYANPENNGWRTSCFNRILITSTTLSASDLKKEQFLNTATYTITNFITFEKQDWAVADNTHPTQGSFGCQTKFLRLPLDTDVVSSPGLTNQDGLPPGPTVTTSPNSPGPWRVAADDGLTRALLTSYDVNFGTLCLTVDGGASYHWGNADNCSDPGAGSLAFYKSPGLTVFGIISCSRRLLLTRTSISKATWESRAPVTSTFRYYDWEFAVPDNIAVDSTQIGCTSKPFMVDTINGWSVASPSQPFLQDAIKFAYKTYQTSVFGTYCLVLSDGSSMESNTAVIGGSCPSDALSQTTVSGFLFVTSKRCHSRPLLVKRHNDTEKSLVPPFTLGMKVLLISLYDNVVQEARVGTALDNLRAFGIPFDWFVAFDSTTQSCKFGTDLGLWRKDASGAVVGGNYYAIVMTNKDLMIYSATNSYSCLSPDQAADLQDYKLKFGVRLVSLFSYPDPSTMNVITQGGNSQPITVTLSDPTFAYGLKQNVSFSTKAGQTFHYPAAVYDRTKANVSPFMKFEDNSIAAAVITQKQGDQELHFFFDPVRWLPMGPGLANIYLNWVTRGIYLGFRRTLLSTQIDDYHLPTVTWDADKKMKGTTAFLASDADLDNLYQWQKEFNAKLPQGSNVVIEHIINGRGMWTSGTPNPVDPKQDKGFLGDTRSLYNSTVRHLNDFFWVSHTWSHEDLTCDAATCYYSQADIRPAGAGCTFLQALTYINGCYLVPLWGYGYYSQNAQQFSPELVAPGRATSYAKVNDELSRNFDAIQYRLFNDSVVPGGLSAYSRSFSRSSLVCPRISGLFNKYALQAMIDNGITNVVGDNSRPELWPYPPALNGGTYGTDWPPALYQDPNAAQFLKINFYHGRWLTEAVNGYSDPTRYFRQVFMIPRSATNVYYDVKSLEELQSEYNFFYSSTGILSSAASGQTYSQIYDTEATRTVQNLLAYRHDPYMFHQANIVSFNTTLPDGTTGVRSLVGMWIERVLQEYYKYSTLPVQTLKMSDLADLYIERMERENDCALQGSIMVTSNRVALINITSQYPSPNGCVARLTGASIADFAYVPATVQESVYGPDTTLRVPIPGSKFSTLPLGNPPPSSPPTYGTTVVLAYKSTSPSVAWNVA